MATDWVLDLICCGHDDGHQGCASWEAADLFRDDYIKADGHDRAAILRRAHPGEPMGYFERSVPSQNAAHIDCSGAAK